VGDFGVFSNWLGENSDIDRDGVFLHHPVSGFAHVACLHQTVKMLRIVPVIGLALVVPSLLGCGLLDGNKSPKFHETPPYYKTDKDAMIDHAKIYRQSELSRLERDASEIESERKREEAAAEKKKKNNWKENWFGKGDETFMMSDKAKRINSNLDR
jgi:hypothetical protein